ncbi:MAG TPA: hypothetical protein VHV77_00135 [Pirellulales bacterium]|nr:hypothetical protein [Pirellulales bacterium]
MAAVLLASTLARADWRDSFETPDPVWTDIGGDARYRIDVQQRVQTGAHSGNGCEYLQLTASAGGRTALLSYNLGRAPIINELRPSVWVRADRNGVQVFARVVMPRALDTSTGQPMTTLIAGGQYTSAGAWQELRLDELSTLLARQAWVMRAQLHREIDIREAFVDRIVLNVYTGPGRTVLSIDDLTVEGIVPSGPSAEVALPLVSSDGRRIDSVSHRSTVELNGSVLLADSRPIFPRALEHRGEALSFVRRLGFNAVRLASPPSMELAEEARREGLWIISPPPTAESLDGRGGLAIAAIPPELDRVLAWDVGPGLTRGELESTRRTIEALRRADSQIARPIIADVEAELFAYSRMLDALVLRREPLGTSFEENDYATWMRERMRLARPGTPFWATIQTQLAPELCKQLEMLSGGMVREVGVDADQVRALVFTALAGGAGGVMFRSNSRLDADDSLTRARAADLESLNLELIMLEPWTAAGRSVSIVSGSNFAPPKPPPASTRSNRTGNKRTFLNPQQTIAPDVKAFVLQTDRARLLMPIWSGGGSQFVASQWAGTNLSFVVPGVSEATDVYQITPSGLRPPFKRQRVTGGIRVTFDEFSMTDVAVLTQDPLVVATLMERLGQIGRRATELERQRASEKLLFITETEARLAAAGHTTIKTSEWLAAARMSLARSDERLATNDLATAFLEARRAHRPLQRIARAHWAEAIKPLSSPLASPLAASYATLPEHYRFAPVMADDRWGWSELPAGNFEYIEEMISTGWVHLQHPHEGVKAEVELSDKEHHGGRLSLRLAAKPKDEEAAIGIIETSPVWVESPPVQVEAGQWIRIQGWILVPTAINGSVEGLMIIDSQNGAALAERIGVAERWQKFTMIRAMPRSGPLTVTFALTGLGEAWIDEVSIQRLVDPRQARR